MRPTIIPEFEIPEYLAPKPKMNGSTIKLNGSNKKHVVARDDDDFVMTEMNGNKQATPGPYHPALRIPSTLTLGFGDFTTMASESYQIQKLFSSSLSSNDKSSNFEKYDALVTLFLIDTAENALQYLESIHDLLKPGGIWINYGPLKWGSAPQVEFTLEELEMVIDKMGFRFESKWAGENEYNGDDHSLWQGRYKIRGWTARKASG